MTSLGPDTVLRPMPGVVEHPIGVEALLWHPDQRIPVQLNQSAAVIWWHVDGESPLGTVAAEVAEAFGEPVDTVARSVASLCAQLVDQGLLIGLGRNLRPGRAAEQPKSLEPRRQAWLDDMARHRVGIAGTTWSVCANTDDALAIVREALGEAATEVDDHEGGAVYATLVDGGSWDVGDRWWLLSAAGYPLSSASEASVLVADLAVAVADVTHDPAANVVGYRLATVHDGAVAHLVQWDLLAARPVLEELLRRRGWTVRPSQDAWIDEELCVTVDQQRLPVRSILLWTGPGSIETPTSVGAWVWTLSVLAACGPAERPVDREATVERSAWMVERLALRCSEDAGPSVVVAHLDEFGGAG